MSKIRQKWIAAVFIFGWGWAAAGTQAFPVKAEEIQAEAIAQETEARKVVTEYSDLWTGTITFQTGIPVQWIVHVPEDTEPKGCGATIKIPGIGWGTDTHNKEEGHLTLTKGDNLVYEFTPDTVGDYLFTCWMGSGCHSNYFHVTDDGEYAVSVPDDPTDIRIERNGSSAVVSFTEPEAPDGAEITGYKIIATDSDGKRTKASGKSSPVTLENTDASKSYTFQIITLATSGASRGENSTVLEAETETAETEPAETQAPQENQQTEASQPASVTGLLTQTTTVQSDPSITTGKTAETTVSQTKTEQIIITEFADLWKEKITVKRGVPVKWYVNVPEKADLSGCDATIKIPGLGWGTDTDNSNENHLTLTAGKQLVYEFTPEKTGDILFTCLMGSGCHANYFHVVDVEVAADTGSGSTAAVSSVQTTALSSGSAAKKTEGPKTSSTSVHWIILILVSAVGVLFVTKRKKNRHTAE